MSSPMVRKWYGSVGKLMQDHLALRASMGIVGNAETVVLHQFNCFLHEQYPRLKTPNRYSILHFLDTKKHLTAWGRRNAVIHIRQFCRFLNQRGVTCYVPDKTLTPKLTYKPRYFPLNVDDVKALMCGMRLVRANHPFVGETYSTMVGLLWCTGMRRKEVISLNHSDVDLKERTILIRETKFRKTRMIPIDRSVTEVLERYLLQKKKLKYPITPNNAFFSNLSGTRVRGGNLHHTFKRVVKRVGLIGADGTYPVLHDLRHNFATQTLRRLYADTERWPSQTVLNVLATYLGHSDMLYSQYYLHPDFDLLLKASKRFAHGRKAA
jgi:integrase/recombinase XerD